MCVIAISNDDIALNPSVIDIDRALAGIVVTISQNRWRYDETHPEITQESLAFIHELLLNGELEAKSLSTLRLCLCIYRIWLVAKKQEGHFSLPAYPNLRLVVDIGARYTILDRGLRQSSSSR